MDSSLDFRKDNRSLSVFKDNIKDYTKREQVWAEALHKDFIARYKKRVKKVNTGVDNTGKLITGKLPSGDNFDFSFVIKGVETKVEICTIPEFCKFNTFKSYKLQQCLEKGVLIIVPKLAAYSIYTIPAIKFVLSLEESIYPNFSPNDPARRIEAEDIQMLVDKGFIESNEWLPGAKSFINSKRDILVKAKRT